VEEVGGKTLSELGCLSGGNTWFSGGKNGIIEDKGS
jgi:hypothetical protein